MEPQRVRIILVDPYDLFREGLRRLLKESREFACVGAAKNEEQTLQLVSELVPELLILDLCALSDVGDVGIFLDKIRLVAQHCKIIVLTHCENEADIEACIRSGVDGYLLKNLSEAQLLNAIRTVCSGEQVLCEKARLRLSQVLKGSYDKKKHPLRQREIELIKLAAEGLTNKEIARQLNISEHTVASHFISIYRKLNIGSRAEAVRLSMENGWITAVGDAAKPVVRP